MKKSKKTSEYPTLGREGAGEAEPASASAAGGGEAAATNGGRAGDGRAAPSDENGAGEELPPTGLPAPTAEERVAVLEAERDELKDRMLRIAADFENFKKRSVKTQEDAIAHAREAVLRDMLEVIDNLERATAMQTAGDGHVDGAAVLKGVGLVLRVFLQKLERYGVRPFEAKGQPFDPHLHEAISRIESDEVPAGSVAAELQKGYRVGERLLRPAMVSVSAGPKSPGG